jgi:hypothetical protein
MSATASAGPPKRMKRRGSAREAGASLRVVRLAQAKTTKAPKTEEVTCSNAVRCTWWPTSMTRTPR